MAFPTKPSIPTSFTAEEQALGDGSFPGQEIDVALANLRDSTEEIIDFLGLFTRSDGALKNGIVTSDSLAAALTIGFDPPAPWATSTAYTTSSTVFEGYGFYLCLVAHTSGTFSTDLAAGRWQLLADLTPPSGGLIASNNLSDVADAATARANLGAQVAVTGGASSITTSNLTASRALVSDGSGKVGVSTVTATQLATIGTGTNLSSLAGLTLAANKGLYSTAANTLALFDLTAAGRALLDDADAAAQRTTLGATATGSAIFTAADAAAVRTAAGLGGLATLDILDEDDMASDSATRPPSQQSVKAYVDGMAAGGTTLLATIPTTSGTSVSATSLDLSGYKFLKIVFDGVSFGTTTGSAITINSYAVSPTDGNNNYAYRGTMDIDLSDGVFSSAVAHLNGTAVVNSGVFAGLSNITTASTTVTFSRSGSGTFDAGEIRIYGVP